MKQIKRSTKNELINNINKLENQVVIIRGCRQVGKTALVLDCLNEFLPRQRVLVNALFPRSFTHDAVEYFGRDFLGHDESGEEFLRNLEGLVRDRSIEANLPLIVFIDEADQYPLILEAVQSLALHSNKYRFIFTGSNLENIVLKNAATGRKSFFDIYPITFIEYLRALGEEALCKSLEDISLTSLVENNKKGKLNAPIITEYLHNKALRHVDNYVRFGGMPKILSANLENASSGEMSRMMTDLVVSIEENVKSVLDEKSKLYEYVDVLRQIAISSANTLKISRLQVQHAKRAEAKKLVNKSVGARIVHKIRLFDADSDLSKYTLADTGITNYLLSGSDLIKNRWSSDQVGIMWETFATVALISQLPSRDDLFYWKSENKAEVEFLLRAPICVGIDIKANTGNFKSLNSFALNVPEAEMLIKVNRDKFRYLPDYQAKDLISDKSRKIPTLEIPHYMIPFLMGLLKN